MSHHIEESRLLAHLDGELAPGDAARVEEHLDECEECRGLYGRLESRSRLFSRAVAVMDVEASPVGWDQILERAGADPDGEGHAAGSDPAPDPAPSAPRSTGTPGRAAPFLKAAAILLAVTGVAAAIPGSPVDDWLGAAANRVTGWLAGDDGTPSTEAPETSAVEDGRPGVAVALDGGKVTVSLIDAAAGTSVEVSLTAGRQAELEAEGGRYRTAPGQIEVLGATGDRILVRLPEIATDARILVDGRPAVRLESGRLRLLLDGGASSESSLTFHIPGPPDG